MKGTILIDILQHITEIFEYSRRWRKNNPEKAFSSQKTGFEGAYFKLLGHNINIVIVPEASIRRLEQASKKFCVQSCHQQV